MFSEYESFLLKSDLPGVPAGTRGVVLMVFGGDPCSYEVEFPDDEGGNLGDQVSYTITDELMLPEKD